MDETFGARLETLREKLRALEDGIRHLQARLAAWDRFDGERAREPSRDEVVAMPVMEVGP